MPQTPPAPATDGAVAQSDAIFADEEQAQTETVGATAPSATEPLQPTELEVVRDMLLEAMSTLSEGQLDSVLEERLAPIEFTEPAEAMPPELWTLVLSLFLTLQQAAETGAKAAAQYAEFDFAAAAQSNKGLQELASVLNQAAGDQKLLNAMKQLPGQGEPPAPEGEPEEAQPAGRTPADIRKDLEE